MSANWHARSESYKIQVSVNDRHLQCNILCQTKVRIQTSDPNIVMYSNLRQWEAFYLHKSGNTSESVHLVAVKIVRSIMVREEALYNLLIRPRFLLCRLNNKWDALFSRIFLEEFGGGPRRIGKSCLKQLTNNLVHEGMLMCPSEWCVNSMQTCTLFFLPLSDDRNMAARRYV